MKPVGMARQHRSRPRHARRGGRSPGPTTLTARGARTLGPLLDRLLDGELLGTRLASDPVSFPRRFARPDDAEIAGLVAACLAYGRADFFLGKLEVLFGLMGPRPGLYARSFQARRDAPGFRGFVYRFNVGADLATLISAAGRVQSQSGSLGAAFAEALAATGDTRSALARFVGRLRASADPAIAAELGPCRAFEHLLPSPERGGACKRLLLFLRWMVRGGPGDPVDLGLWPEVPASALVIPLDTHVARIARLLALTRRGDLSWRTAVEVTDSLRRLDPRDPVKYDFALCHLGMSGLCPARPAARRCGCCPLASACLGPSRRGEN